MNPLTNVKNTAKINETELKMGIAGDESRSWHQKYRESAWIFFGGVPFDLTEGDLICVFSQYGEIVNINLIRDNKTGKSRGFGFLCYEDQRSTVLAVDNFNGVKLLSRIIRVDHAADYKIPKEFGDKDLLSRQLIEQGCAPKPIFDAVKPEPNKDDILPLKEEPTSDRGSQRMNKDKKHKKHKRHKQRSGEHKAHKIAAKRKHPPPESSSESEVEKVPYQDFRTVETDYSGDSALDYQKSKQLVSSPRRRHMESKHAYCSDKSKSRSPKRPKLSGDVTATTDRYGGMEDSKREETRARNDSSQAVTSEHQNRKGLNTGTTQGLQTKFHAAHRSKLFSKKSKRTEDNSGVKDVRPSNDTRVPSRYN